MKQLAKHYDEFPPRSSTLNSVAVELGIQKTEPLPDAFSHASKDRYTDLIRAIYDLFDGKTEASEYEDRCRSFFGTNAYLVFTIDKVVQAVIKQIQAIQADPRSLDLVGLYIKDREKSTTSSRQEAVYRLNVEGLVQDEALFRLEYVSCLFDFYCFPFISSFIFLNLVP
jgi:paired amphipathic helix protein Sin3a